MILFFLDTFKEATLAARKYSGNGWLILFNYYQSYFPGEFEVPRAIKCIQQTYIQWNIIL